MSEEKNLPAIIESILFVHGEPLEVKRLAAISDASEDDVSAALKDLAKHLDGRGLALIEAYGAWQLGSHPSSAPYVEALVKGQFGEALSRAAMETLAVIAYQGPMTRADIEHVRGVNSSFSVRALVMRGLVERADNSKDSRSMLYRASTDLLKHFGLSRMEDLPRYEELRREAARAASGEMPSKEKAT